MDTVTYEAYHSVPNDQIRDELLRVHHAILGDAATIIDRLEKQQNILICLAKDGEKIIGYKIGYGLSDEKFSSWLGGVDSQYRGQGIAKKLMEMQHRLIREKGFRVVQTKTLNRYRPMLLLNIQSVFDIVSTYIDKRNELKIVLEKKLEVEHDGESPRENGR